MLARRNLLQATASVLAATAAHSCAGPVRNRPNPAFLNAPVTAGEGKVVLGFYDASDMLDVCRSLIPKITDMSWLSPGDSVFIKVACNSGNKHPAVTAPEAITAMVQYLRERGAKTIYVGDQAGVEHVRLTAKGRLSSTRELMANNGQLSAIEASGATLHNFDDQAYESYFAPHPSFKNHWGRHIFLPQILKSVDHVINLPRLGTHALAGITCGAKNAVGWLRDDSRLHLHQKGHTFFEQIAEINAFTPLQQKQRLTLTLGRSALLNIGPDFGSQVDLGQVVAFGSGQLLNHDVLATELLLWLDQEDTSFYDLYAPYPEDADIFNRTLVRQVWGDEAMKGYRRLVAFNLDRGLAYDRCLSHLSVVQGYRPKHIAIERDGSPIPKRLLKRLSNRQDGLFAV